MILIANKFQSLMKKLKFKISYIQATEAFLEFKGEKMENIKKGNIIKL
jgi:ribosomal protein S3AE